MASRPPRGGSSQPPSYPPVRVRIKKGDVTKVTPSANQPQQGTGNSSNINESQLVAQATPNSSTVSLHLVSHIPFVSDQSSSVQDTKTTEDDIISPEAHEDKSNHDILTGPSESDTTNFNQKKSSENK